MKKRALAIALSLALLLSVFVPGTLATSSTETETDTTTVVSQPDTEVLAEDGEGTRSGDEQTALTDGETVTGDGQTTDEDSVTGDGQTTDQGAVTDDGQTTDQGTVTGDGQTAGEGTVTGDGQTAGEGTVTGDGQTVDEGNVTGDGQTADPTETTAATDPTETTAATDPTETTAATDPTETTAATDPTETTGPVCTCPGTEEEKAAEGFIHQEGCPHYVEQEPETIVDRTIETSVDGLTFAVKGSLPESAELSVSALGSTAGEFIRSDVLNLDELPDGYTGSAFDIKILDKETGAEIEPAAPVTVTVYGTDTTEESDVQVYHLPDTDAEDVNAMMSVQTMRAAVSMFALAPAETTSGSGEEIASVYAGDAYITFTADSFSVYYIVTGTKDGNLSAQDGDVIQAMPGSTFVLNDIWSVSGSTPTGVSVSRSGGTTKVSIGANVASGTEFVLSREVEQFWWTYTITVTVEVLSQNDVVENARASEVYLTILTNATNIPGEPGNTDDSFLHFDESYSLSYAWDDKVFSTNGQSIIKQEIVNHADIALAIDGSSTIGLVDNTGAKTKAVLTGIDWDKALNAIAEHNEGAGQRETKIYASDGQLVTLENMDQYVLIPYVVKYKSQSFRWHIDCAVVKKENVSLIYNLNIDANQYRIPEGSPVPNVPATTSGQNPYKTTVQSMTNLGDAGTIEVQDRTSGDAPMTLTFKEWNTEPDGSGVSYDPGDQITITENTTLYAIWEGELIPGTLQISKTVAADKDVEVPDETFTFSVDLTKGGEPLSDNYTYVVKDKTGVQVSIGTISSGGRLTLKANQTAVISGLPHNVSYTVTEVEIPLGFTSDQANDSAAGTVTGGQTSTVAFVNTYVPPVADLTIIKTGWQPVDENQTFVFLVTGEDVSMEVAICRNGKVVIKDLPLGEYTITETGWSWRYQPDGGNKTVNLDADQSVTFSNSRVNNQWLNGSAYDNNSFAGIESN